MPLLNIAVDVRLAIYMELLVLPEAIHFCADYGPPSPPLVRSRWDRLHPAILQVNRLIYHEAVPLLYSNNRFQFPEVMGEAHSADHAYIRPFLEQIGVRASLVHHITIPFPRFEYGTVGLHKVHIENLELIATKTSVRTLELLVSPEEANYDVRDMQSEALDMLGRHLKSIHSLQDVTITFEEYPGGEPDEEIAEKMRDIGWIVKVKRLPMKTWISADDRVEFDDEEECRAYDEEQSRREWALEEQREEELWQEEISRRRADPYWKNDSDFD